MTAVNPTDVILSDIKRKENELLNLKTRCSDSPATLPPKPSASSASSNENDGEIAVVRPRRITRESFLSMQKKTSSNKSDEKLLNSSLLDDLIRMPRRRTHSVQQVRDIDGERKEASMTSSSLESFGINHRTEVEKYVDTHISEEKRRVEVDYKGHIETLKSEIEKLRRSRECARNAFRVAREEAAQTIQKLQARLADMEDEKRKSENEKELLEIRYRELETDLKNNAKELESLTAQWLQMKELTEDVSNRNDTEKEHLLEQTGQLRRTINHLKDAMAKNAHEEEKLKLQVTELSQQVTDLKSHLRTAKNKEQLQRNQITDLTQKNEAEVSQRENRLLEAEAELVTLRQKLEFEEQRSEKLRREKETLRSQKLDFQKLLETRDREAQELSQFKSSYEAIKTDNLCLMSKVKHLQNEVDELEGELSECRGELHRAVLSAQDKEQELHKCRNELTYMSSSQVTRSAAVNRNKSQIDLSDARGRPIQKLKQVSQDSRDNQYLSRPSTWVTNVTSPGPISEIVIPTKTSYFSPQGSLESVPKQPSNTVTCRKRSMVDLLQTERLSIIREISSMSPNPNFRTSDQNEKWQSLQARRLEIENDLKSLYD